MEFFNFVRMCDIVHAGLTLFAFTYIICVSEELLASGTDVSWIVDSGGTLYISSTVTTHVVVGVINHINRTELTNLHLRYY